MNTPLEELMRDAHRAECDGGLCGNHQGLVTDVRGEEAVMVDCLTTPERLTVHNLGVCNGIEAFLNRLDEAGYTLTDRYGRKVSKGKHEKLGDAFRSWYRHITPNLRIVK